MRRHRRNALASVAAALALCAPALADEWSPKPLGTPGLPSLGPAWRKTNPFRGDSTALKLGEAGFRLDCARCHGEAAVGGVAGMEKVPSLRLMDKDEAGDALYIAHTRNGYVESGVVKAPAFEGVLSQEAMWAIRTYLDSRYDGD